jgi:hypothetical protein
LKDCPFPDIWHVPVSGIGLISTTHVVSPANKGKLTQRRG